MIHPRHPAPTRNVALLGHGPIAAYVSARLTTHESIRLHTILCRRGKETSARRIAAAGAAEPPRICTGAADIDANVIDLAVDCTGHAGLLEHGPTLLENGIDLLSISTGALSDRNAASRLEHAARLGGSRLRFATGAIGGIDALSAARVDDLQHVVYTGRKPPLGWKGTAAEESLNLDALLEPAVHFEGSARQAAARYPKNANVAAVVALAGLGLDATMVSLIADPTVDRNCHEISAMGAFGSLRLELQGTSLPDNPKSSALAAMSVVRAIESILFNADHAGLGIICATRGVDAD